MKVYTEKAKERILKLLEDDKAYTPTYISKNLGFHYYLIRDALKELEDEKKVKRTSYPNGIEFYEGVRVKNGEQVKEE